MSQFSDGGVSIPIPPWSGSWGRRQGFKEMRPGEHVEAQKWRSKVCCGDLRYMMIYYELSIYIEYSRLLKPCRYIKTMVRTQPTILAF